MKWELISDLKDAHTATHLISPMPMKRTPKLLIAMCCTNNIVGIEWLDACMKEGKAVKTRKFQLTRDKEAETKYNFSMADSLKRAAERRHQNKKLLDGFDVFFCRHVAGNTSKQNRTPKLSEYRSILEAAGATIVNALPDDTTNTIVVTSKIDKEAKAQLKALKKTVHVSKTTDELFQILMDQQFET